jgi:peptidyl-prolyl cis-trans isomerase C
MAVELSDDRSAVRNKGRLPPVTAGKVDPAFEKAAAALKKSGELSEPVLSRFGYHIIRLEARKPAREKSFNEVRGQILREMQQKRITEARDSAIADIRSDKRLVVNQEAVDALVVDVDVPSPPADSSAPKAKAPAPTRKK